MEEVPGELGFCFILRAVHDALSAACPFPSFSPFFSKQILRASAPR